MREDLDLAADAQRLGWKAKKGNRAGDPTIFSKGDVVLWECIHNGKLAWACADLSKGRGRLLHGHRYYDTLQLALTTEP